jgi:Asp-tRNA(Asn)/Glu-tRNA(Gln) amidotransferase A subunit family amidase
LGKCGACKNAEMIQWTQVAKVFRTVADGQGSQVLAQARERDTRRTFGALHGVPFGIKDLIDTFDMPTWYGSPIYAGNQPHNDAACVAIVTDRQLFEAACWVHRPIA